MVTRASTFRLQVEDKVELFGYRFEPEGECKAVVQIAHGMAEHAARYARFAEALNAAGYAVYANDHRGHGHTAPNADELGFLAQSDGWRRVVSDLHELRLRIASDHPGRPLFLFGHSMGSFLAQQYLFEHAAGLAGVVLSGTSGGGGLLASAGRLVAIAERARLGPRGRSPLLQALTLGSYNRQFGTTRTEFDWLSRDSAEVDKYIADRLCGFALTVQAWVDVLGALIELGDERNLRRVPAELPIHLVSGALDPVGGNTKGVRWLINGYARAGIRRVTHRFYEGARHELLNEINRDEVQRDLITWLDSVLVEVRTP